MPDLNNAANTAIKKIVLEKRPNFQGSWMIATPSKGQLSFEFQAWMGFLGDVIAEYNANPEVTPRHTADITAFEGLRKKQLIKLRDAMVEKTS